MKALLVLIALTVASISFAAEVQEVDCGAISDSTGSVVVTPAVSGSSTVIKK